MISLKKWEILILNARASVSLVPDCKVFYLVFYFIGTSGMLSLAGTIFIEILNIFSCKNLLSYLIQNNEKSLKTIFCPLENYDFWSSEASGNKNS